MLHKLFSKPKKHPQLSAKINQKNLTPARKLLYDQIHGATAGINIIHNKLIRITSSKYLSVSRRFAVVAGSIRFCKGESHRVWVLNNFK